MASGGRCSPAQEYVPQRWQADGVRRTLADDFSFMCVDMTWRGPPPSLLFPCARAPGPAAPLAGPLALRRHARATAHTGPCAFPACTHQQRPPWPPPHAAPRAHAREPKPERRRARRWQLLCFVVSVYVAASAAFAAAFWALHWASPDMLAGDKPAGMSLAEARAPLTAFAVHPGHCPQLVTGRGRSAAAQLPHCEKAAVPCVRPCVASGGQRACRAASAPGPPRHAARGSPAQHAREPAWRLCCRAGVPLVLRHQPGHDRLRQLGAPRHGYRPALSGVAVPFPIGANIRLCRQGRWGLSEQSGCIAVYLVALTAAAVTLTWVRAPQTPQTRSGYMLSTAEQFVGLLLSALLLGVVVTKASVPSAKLVFSKARALGRTAVRPPPARPPLARPPSRSLRLQGRVRAFGSGGGPRAGCRARRRAQVMVMSRRDGRWVLTCRIGNARGNFLYNPEIRLAYLFPTATGEGERLWAARARTRPAAPVPPARLGEAGLRHC